MKKTAFIFLTALFFFPAILSANSKLHGCTDSPENATAVLGLVVSGAGIGFVQLRNRIATRKKSGEKKLK